jgi:ribosome-associated translation inhibitor RaiA
MIFQIHSDNNVRVSNGLSAFIKAEIDRDLKRFQRRLTRVEVFLGDSNGEKAGPQEKRCVMETRPKGYQRVSVKVQAATLETAVATAAKKMEKLLNSKLGRLADRRWATLDSLDTVS